MSLLKISMSQNGSSCGTGPSADEGRTSSTAVGSLLERVIHPSLDSLAYTVEEGRLE